MNEYEIDEAARFYAHDPILGKATRFLQQFKDEVNGHSDGWAYWKPAMSSAGKLMTLIRSASCNPEWDEADAGAKEKMFLKALTPIKSFMTRHGVSAGMRMPLVQEDTSERLPIFASSHFCRSQSMANEPQSGECLSLSTIVEHCLTSLQSLSLALDTYGNEDHAAVLHEIIAQLQKPFPAPSVPATDSMDFIVNATFKVSRQQVAGALSCAFGSQITRFRVAELNEPPAFRFRSIEHLTHRLVDYALNEGGSLGIVSTEPASDVFRLDLKSIGQGLDALATKYPRHFADLVNENTDAITVNALLQCCLFGELIYE